MDTNSLDGFTHVEAHFDAVLGVFGQRHRQPRHTVVAISQDLNSHAFVLLRRSEDEEEKRQGENTV